MDKTKKIDKRIIKTKKQIYNGLLKQLEEKPLEVIRVSDICKTAHVNRTTFYAHFKDKNILFDEFIKETQATLITELSKIKSIKSLKTYYMEIINALLKHMKEEKDVYKTIMKHNKYNIILDTTQKTILDYLHQKMNDELQKKTEIPLEFIAVFYLGGLINIGMKWIDKGDKYTIEQVSNYIDSLIPEKIK